MRIPQGELEGDAENIFKRRRADLLATRREAYWGMLTRRTDESHLHRSVDGARVTTAARGPLSTNEFHKVSARANRKAADAVHDRRETRSILMESDETGDFSRVGYPPGWSGLLEQGDSIN